jgi:hypothetical protein
MAKRKQASLTDKTPEALGLTQKKGKGLDLLFGSSAAPSTTTLPPASGAQTEGQNLEAIDSSGSVDIVATGVAVAEREVDELGLPVALEAPPDDLILASPEASSATGEADAVDPSTSPFALPTSPSLNVGDPTIDLAGIVADETSLEMEDETLSSLADANDLTGLVTGSTPADTSEDLSGIVEDLSGIVVDNASTNLAGLTADVPSAQPIAPEGAPSGLTDTSSAGAAAPPTPAATPFSQPSPPPTTAAPISVSSSPVVTPPFSAGPTVTPVSTFPTSAPTYTPPPPAPHIPPPSISTGAPSMAAPRPGPIEMAGLSTEVAGALGAFGSALPDTREAFLPKDELPDDALIVREREQVERDDEITARVLNYIGPQRRDNLFEEIRELHERVAKELSANRADVTFALNTLREANEFIIEDPRQYDEALYRVAMVRSMLYRKQKLNFWSYRLGLAIFAYGIGLTLLFMLGYFAPINFEALLPNAELGAIFLAVWYSGLAGGLGGCVEIFWRLYYRVSVKQDFDPQYLMYYLVKPVLGFVLGLIMYFLVAVGSTLMGAATTLPQAGTNTGFVFAILLGFFAGFRQESVFDMIYVIFKKIAPVPGDTKPKSFIPVEEADSITTSS